MQTLQLCLQQLSLLTQVLALSDNQPCEMQFVLFMGFIMSVQLLPAWLIPSKADYRHAAKVRKAQRA